MSIYLVIKFVTQLLLFIIFLFVFGIPSLERFYAKDVLTTVEERSSNYIIMPAITICQRSVVRSYKYLYFHFASE